MIFHKLFRIILLFLLSFESILVSAKSDNEMTLTEWASKQTEVLPEIVNGVKMYRPELAGEQLIISDMTEIPAGQARQIFLKALMYFREKSNPEFERIEAVDFKNLRFTVRCDKEKVGDDTSEVFSYTEAFQGTDGLLSFSCSDISVGFKEKGLIPRILKFEKLKPQINPRDRNWIESQAFIFSNKMSDIAKYVKLHESIKVNHEDEIIKGKIVQGMNPDEVVLTLGQPFSKKKSGGRDKWLFESGASIIFTDGVVSHIMF